jgi:hypothetical protein
MSKKTLCTLICLGVILTIALSLVVSCCQRIAGRGDARRVLL